MPVVAALIAWLFISSCSKKTETAIKPLTVNDLNQSAYQVISLQVDKDQDDVTNYFFGNLMQPGLTLNLQCSIFDPAHSAVQVNSFLISDTAQNQYSRPITLSKTDAENIVSIDFGQGSYNSCVQNYNVPNGLVAINAVTNFNYIQGTEPGSVASVCFSFEPSVLKGNYKISGDAAAPKLDLIQPAINGYPVHIQLTVNFFHE